MAGLLCFFWTQRPADARAADRPEVCLLKESQACEAWLRDVTACESAWNQYRVLQAKIRALYYEPLWKSRVDGSHPLDEKLREDGQKREAYYMRRIRELESESVEKSNEILALLQRLQSRQHYFKNISEDTVLQDCYDLALLPAQTILKDALSALIRIQEAERDYHVAVRATSGRESGRYPEDTVERGGTHDDLYERFELERGAKRYEEDLAMMRFFEALRYFAEENLPQAGCCLKQEASTYDQKLKTVRF